MAIQKITTQSITFFNQTLHKFHVSIQYFLYSSNINQVLNLLPIWTRLLLYLKRIQKSVG